MLAMALLTSCTLDSAMFNAQPLADYTLPTSVIPADRRTAFTVRSGGETLYGFHVRQVDSVRIRPQPTIVYHHGNRQHLGEYWDRVELLYRAGFDVVIYDYRGYGRSSGTSTATSLLEDADAIHDWLWKQADVDTTHIIAYGYSLGGVPALHQAGRPRGNAPRALITESIFASGDDLVQSATQLDIPGRYVLEHGFDNRTTIGNVTCPILMLHGADDRYLPYERHALALQDLAPEPHVFVRVAGADHTNVPATMGEQAYIDLLIAFIRGS